MSNPLELDRFERRVEHPRVSDNTGATVIRPAALACFIAASACLVQAAGAQGTVRIIDAQQAREQAEREAAARAAAKVPESPCAALSRETSTSVALRLQAFETVYGKRAINWTQEDFDRVIGLAYSCQGFVIKGGNPVHAPDWVLSINQARQKVTEMAALVKAVEEYGRNLKPEAIRLPFCGKVLDYALDDFQQADNSREIFGQDVMEMSDGDLDRVVKYVNYCIAYLPEYANSTRGWLPDNTLKAIYRIMDRALLVQKRRQEWVGWQKRPTDLVVEVNGVRVPPTMTTADTREMVVRFNRATALQRRFTPETVATLLRLTDEVMVKPTTVYDKLYAEAVKQRLQSEIFRNQ